MARRFGVADRGRPADAWLLRDRALAWRTRILATLEHDMRSGCGRRRGRSDPGVRRQPARPAARRARRQPRHMGLDPGMRTGVKVAVVDGTGKVVATDTIYPHEPRKVGRGAAPTLARLARKHQVELVAIGNGTASRETDKLAAELISAHPELKLTKVDGVRGRRVGVFGVGLASRSCPIWTCRCAARSRSPGGCRTRSPNW